MSTDASKKDDCVELKPSIRHLESSGCETQEERDSIPAPACASDFFPDGGYRAWLNVVAGWLTLFASIGFTNGLSVFQSYYSLTILSAYSPSDIAWIGSIQFWGCFFFGLWAGRLSDKYGPRIPLGIGTCFLVLGIMTASVSTKFYQLILSQGLCIGLGSGLVFPPAVAIQSQWFLKKRGFVVGLVMSGQNLGGVVWPIVVNQLIEYDGISLGWSLRIIGFLQLFLMVIATLLVQARFHDIPQEPLPLKAFATNVHTVLFTLSTVVFFLGIFVPYFFVSSYGMKWGASTGEALYLSSILNAAAFFGCYAWGIAADAWMGHFDTLTLAAFCAAITTFGWIGVRTYTGTVAWSVAYGFMSGGVQALFSPCLSYLAPSPALIATWNGIFLTILSLPVLGTGPIAGRLLSNTQDDNYLPMQLFTGIVAIVGSFLFLATRFAVSRNGGI
ncbi:major facilitator superfamily domain-containing protein [Aspergillus pseudocaelatus]|uniref:Major facilitator superfamily domain-containing protein n=1 Tax=Aspergillus pseudocaelatus TaxID=1825620 RepID=A0ABQ6WRV0_9EURO|nr:major facilitator superfamily domain-containing protein [Aspergillus pseudocaelatus]